MLCTIRYGILILTKLTGVIDLTIELLCVFLLEFHLSLDKVIYLSLHQEIFGLRSKACTIVQHQLLGCLWEHTLIAILFDCSVPWLHEDVGHMSHDLGVKLVLFIAALPVDSHNALLLGSHPILLTSERCVQHSHVSATTLLEL